MEISYTMHGDYLLPDLTIAEAQPEYGKYGMIRKTFLKNHRKGTYNALLMSGKLTAHLAWIDTQAREQVEQVTALMIQKEGVTEKLKATDQMQWVGLMNNIKARAEESVMSIINN